MTLQGGNGNDVLAERDGNDVLHGGSGTASLIDDSSDDTLSGGAGNDSFVFTPRFGRPSATCSPCRARPSPLSAAMTSVFSKLTSEDPGKEANHVHLQ